jgi:DNA-binding IclR family transcriptional regulator
MSRPALAASRAVGILNFLAAHPTDRFTLSDLASRLGVNLASMHALLNVLADAGYVSRHPRLRTFTLGPSVVALGTAALECHPVIDLARDAARDLAAQTGLEVAVTAPAGDHIVFLARAGEPSPRGISALVGQRVPLVPPLGSVFVAWGDARGWLAQAADPASLEAVLAAVRARGYAVGLEAEAGRGLNLALHDLSSRPRDDHLPEAINAYVAELGTELYQPAELVASRSYQVWHVAAPIFGSDGQVVLALTLLGFDGKLKGRTISAHGERLRDTGLVVTKRSRGRVPLA